MINLSLSHTNIDAIANDWLITLWNYLFNPFDIATNGKRTNRVPYFKTMLMRIKKELKGEKYNKEECRNAYKFVSKFKHDFYKIVTADEKSLAEYSKNYHLKPRATSLFRELMLNLYDNFTENYSYHFFKVLNIRACPYCNREYTFTCDDKIKTRPEFDHFYDKSEYPLLALSFYNLVPSCHICNHVKGTKHVRLNPYFKGFKTKFRIADNDGKILNSAQALTIRKESDFKVKFSHPTKKENANIKVLGLNQLYNMHKDYVLEIIEKAVSYNDAYKAGLINSFQLSGNSLMDVHDFVWGKYLDVAEQEKRPLSKLTKDILDQLGID